MTAFADLLDLQTAVVERVKNPGITDVFPQLVRLAESGFDRKLRCAEQVTTDTVTIASGTAALPTDLQEIIGVYDAAGTEYIAQPLQVLKQVQTRGYFAISGANIVAKNDEDLTIEYYASLPTISGAMTDTNWLLARHPNLYLYGVLLEAAKYLRDADLAASLAPILDMEYQAVAGSDMAYRYSRARVRVAGVTP